MNKIQPVASNKLIIVGTKADSGKGGISTALTGYIEGLREKQIDVEIIESHHGNRNTLITWIYAFITITKLSVKYRSRAVFWFHCGPWLSLFRKFSLAIIPRLFGAKTLGHIHSPTFNQYINGNKTVRIFLSAMLMPYTSLVVLTPWWKELVRKKGINKPVIISSNPNNQHSCDIAAQYLEHPREIKKLQHEGSHDTCNASMKNDQIEINILCMARMVEGKGVEATIEALEYLPKQYRLTIAGDGDKLDNFKRLASQSKAHDRINFTGWVGGTEKNNLLAEADVFCVPSSYDSFGMVFIEAMAFDLPVVAYGWGPIKNVVNDNVGVCCEHVSGAEVAEKIQYVIKHLAKFSGQGPREVIEKYTPIKVAENILRQL